MLSRYWPIALILIAVVAVFAALILLVHPAGMRAKSLKEDPFSGVALVRPTTPTHAPPASRR